MPFTVCLQWLRSVWMLCCCVYLAVLQYQHLHPFCRGAYQFFWLDWEQGMRACSTSLGLLLSELRTARLIRSHAFGRPVGRKATCVTFIFKGSMWMHKKGLVYHVASLLTVEGYAQTDWGLHVAQPLKPCMAATRTISATGTAT